MRGVLASNSEKRLQPKMINRHSSMVIPPNFTAQRSGTAAFNMSQPKILRLHDIEDRQRNHGSTKDRIIGNIEMFRTLGKAETIQALTHKGKTISMTLKKAEPSKSRVQSNLDEMSHRSKLVNEAINKIQHKTFQAEGQSTMAKEIKLNKNFLKSQTEKPTSI